MIIIKIILFKQREREIIKKQTCFKIPNNEKNLNKQTNLEL